MTNPIAPTHEPPASRADVVLENLAPSALAPLSTPSAEPGGVQPNTIVGIVVGLVSFVALILVCSFISKLPCFRPSQPPPTVPRQRQSAHFRASLDPVASDMGIGPGAGHYPVYYLTNGRRLMSRPLEHTEARVAFANPSVHTAPPSYNNCTLDPLPNRGPNPPHNPPPYFEPLQPQYSSEYPHAPQRAILET